MDSDNLPAVWKILTECNFESQFPDIPVKMRCLQCGKILIKPCQVPCGCRFCFDCITDMLGSGLQKCMGNNGDCKNSDLFKFAFDYKLGKKIGCHELNCPVELCNHRCKLVDMSEHLRVCFQQNGNKKCPFYQFGCTGHEMNNDIEGHLNSERLSHSNLVVEVIGTLRNEIVELNSALKQKDEKIELMSKEMEAVYMLLNDIQLNIDGKCEEVKRDCWECVEQKIAAQNEANRRFQSQIATNLESAQCSLTNVFKSVFDWPIRFCDTINCPVQTSAFFSCALQPYKMALNFDLSSRFYRIYLVIHPGLCDDTLPWPFKATVTVKFQSNRHVDDHHDNPDVCRMQSKFCIIQRPSMIDNDSDGQSSEAFKFSADHLRNIGLIQDGCCTVMCFVHA